MLSCSTTAPRTPVLRPAILRERLYALRYSEQEGTEERCRSGKGGTEWVFCFWIRISYFPFGFGQHSPPTSWAPNGATLLPDRFKERNGQEGRRTGRKERKGKRNERREEKVNRKTERKINMRSSNSSRGPPSSPSPTLVLQQSRNLSSPSRTYCSVEPALQVSCHLDRVRDLLQAGVHLQSP